MSETPLYISAQRVEKELDYRSLIDAVERGLANFSKGGVEQPLRTVVPLPKYEGFFASMPVYSRIDDVLAAKLLTYYPNNKKIPTHNAVILVFCTENGALRAIMDGDVITARRTAAASAVATKHLIEGEPKCLTIAGAGVQAKAHYEALSTLYDFEQVKIWNHRTESAQRLASYIGSKASVCTSVEEAAKGADVIVMATATTEPLLKAEWVKKGAHINAVGACRPWQAELYTDLMTSSVVYVDSLESARKESGDIILSKAEVYAEIGEVINGVKDAKKHETTVFKSLGLAIEDAVAAKLLLEKIESS